MDIGELTINQAKELAQMFPSPQQRQSHSFQVGKAYLIRTVTMHYTGRVIAVTDSDVVLEDAAWIADTGRFADSLASGTLNEVEPYPGRVAVCRGGMIDFAEWSHELPRRQK